MAMGTSEPLTLAEIRRLRGFSQRRLAKAANITRQAISLWERGLVTPNLRTAARVAALLNLTPQELLAYVELERLRRATRQATGRVGVASFVGKVADLRKAIREEVKA